MGDVTAGQNVQVLLVDDDPSFRDSLQDVLELEGYSVAVGSHGAEALAYLKKQLPDIIITDVQMPVMDGVELVRTIKHDPEFKYIPTVVHTGANEDALLVSCFEAGADDFIRKGSAAKEVLARMQAVLRLKDVYSSLSRVEREGERLRSQLKSQSSFENMIANSESMQDVCGLIEQMRRSDVPVLITGESGTGKELVARAVHYHSRRSEKPLIIQNCSAFQETLLESELFGYKKGAFSGATRDKEGLFEIADGGSFFLDELGDMPLSLQAKLLRVLQDGTFYSVGSTEEKKVDVRIIAATNKNIPQLIKDGDFREDLYYRLNVIHIHLPPLRERKEDIPELARHFLNSIREREGYGPEGFHADVLKRFMAYNWPGNIRELRNEVERAVILSGDAEEVTVELIQSRAGASELSLEQPIPDSGSSLKVAVEELERRYIERALEETNGNKSEASRLLEISRSSLIAKVQAYGLED